MPENKDVPYFVTMKYPCCNSCSKKKPVNLKEFMAATAKIVTRLKQKCLANTLYIQNTRVESAPLK